MSETRQGDEETFSPIINFLINLGYLKFMDTSRLIFNRKYNLLIYLLSRYLNKIQNIVTYPHNHHRIASNPGCLVFQNPATTKPYICD